MEIYTYAEGEAHSDPLGKLGDLFDAEADG